MANTERSAAPGLSLFLAERYLPTGSAETAADDAKRARAASRQLAAEGTVVRYLGSTLLPADETCFALFEAPSAAEVERLLASASLAYDRVVPALLLGQEET